jgi:uncharacterized protein (TIGR02453 family)
LAGDAPVPGRDRLTQRADPLDLRRTFKFLRGLRANNDRAWFHAHRGDWDAHIRHAFEDLVTMLLLDGARVDPRLAFVDPKTCLFRLANDTRFHTGKAPYKTWLSAWMSPGGKNGAYAGYYLHLSPGASHVSAGIYVPEKPALHGLRSAFLDPARARRFDRLLSAKAVQPLLPLETSPLRVMPRGFDKMHPRADLFRARNYLISRDVPDRELLARGAFTTMRETIRAAAPFVRWLDEQASV